jgi:hypothetical protein
MPMKATVIMALLEQYIWGTECGTVVDESEVKYTGI